MFGSKCKPKDPAETVQLLDEAHKREQADQELEALRKRIESLEKERQTLAAQVADLKLKAKIEDEDIKHMMKMKEERMNLEFQKKELEAQGKRDAEIAKVKDDYRDKLEGFLIKQADNVREMYNQILQRLPDVNVALTGGVRARKS